MYHFNSKPRVDDCDYGRRRKQAIMKHNIIYLVGIILGAAFSLVYTNVISKELWSAIRLVDPDSAAQTFRTTLKADANMDKILVVYSGPTELIDLQTEPHKIKKMELYRLNFEYFLRHGIHCQTQDTILVVTDVVAAKYQTHVDELHHRCQNDFGNFVRLVRRNNTCYDLESIRIALEFAGQGDRPAVMTNTTRSKIVASYYDYFVYLNCGVTGPSPHWSNRDWTSLFLQELRDGVKMTGLSINCMFQSFPHVQSMMYAMDRKGLQTVVDGGAIFDCTKRDGFEGDAFMNNIIFQYEVKLSELILDAGYGISGLVQPISIFRHNFTECRNKHFSNETLEDIWLTSRMNQNFGKVLSLDEVVFFKTSRILTPETAKLINFTLEVDWNW